MTAGTRKQVPDEEWAVRVCLRCHDEFMSTWIGNRICTQCKLSKDFNYETETYKVDL